MMNLTFKPLPKTDGVTTWHPDGLYLHDSDDLKMVVMVGDNMPSPMTVSEAFGDEFIFDGAYMIRGVDEYSERIARARGFIAVLIRKRGSTRRFPDWVHEHSLGASLRRSQAYESWNGE